MIRKSIRMTSLLLAVVLSSAALLTGCGGNTGESAAGNGAGTPPAAQAGAGELAGLLDPQNPVNLTVWHYYNSTQLVAFDNMVLEFNQTTGRELGIFVEAASQGGVNDLAEKVLDTARGVAGAGSLPDIFMAYPDSAYEAMELGLLANLEDYMTPAEIAEYVPSFWEEGIMPPSGQAVIFPVGKSTELLFLDGYAWREYRAALGDEKAPEECLGTWEDVIAAAREYYEYTDALTPDVPGDGRALLGVDSLANFVLATMKQQGVDFTNNLDGQAVIDYDEAALRQVWDTFVVPMAAGWFGSAGRYRSDDVKTGVLMGFLGSSTGSSYFPDVITYEDGSQHPAEMVALPYPVYAQGSPVVIQQGGGMVVSRSEPVREYAAVVFLQWLTDARRNLDFSVDSSYLPVKGEALLGEAMEQTLEEMERSGDILLVNTAQVFRVALEELQNYELYYTPPFSRRLEVRYVLDDLEPLAQEARTRVLELLEAGGSLEDALEEVCGDAAFARWMQSLRGEIESILQS